MGYLEESLDYIRRKRELDVWAENLTDWAWLRSLPWEKRKKLIEANLRIIQRKLNQINNKCS